MTLWFDFAVPVLVTVILARAIWAYLATESSARWLLTVARRHDHAAAPAPWLVVLLPMLREQAVAPETIAAFTSLDYPPGRAAVVVITTERETIARDQRLAEATELARQRPLTTADLRGLLPAARCEPAAQELTAALATDRGTALTALVNSEPTTAQIVEATRPTAGPLPLIHLHQPNQGGRKAGQLNYAVSQLDSILHEYGWNPVEDAAQTYLAVYDADAIPDARTLHAFAEAAHQHRARTGRAPEAIQQQRLPLLGRRPFPAGATGALLTGEWIYQLRRSLGIELARIWLHHYLTTAPLPAFVRTALRPMIYGVGCGLAVQLPALEAIGGFPEPMEDLGAGHRLSLLGAAFAPSTVAVLDEPYVEPAGLTNLHALAFTASSRPDLHARAIAHKASTLSRTAKAVLVLREWADEAAWLLGAPLAAAATASAWWAGPIWTVIAAAGLVLHGPLLTARLLRLAPALHDAVTPPASATRPPTPGPVRPALLIAASPLQPFVRLVGPWRLILRKLAGRPAKFGKTER
ncbi:hypothetical protein E6W39_21905 [Kitasatospora acidiphila]|uniref:Glycosyl transferase n=1 Tax=Kitasatospora acidiphila TaxID=2567942 RepID=A0A540W5T4_9ACTN|nr:hypothetical protein [Kitasatospora acidiphila]TQF04388.1 hypothetical protein E6W39_21905 [Kitasatospora acidiphila]